MTNEKTIGLGTKVRTAAVLTAEPWDRKWGVRQAGALGEVVGHLRSSEVMPPLMVRHEDGSEAPYDADELTPIEALKLGQRVRTAKALRPGACFARAIEVTRRPDTLGEVYGTGPEGAYWLVEHADRSRVPYFADELVPIPDEKAAPATPIGRLRAAVAKVLGGLLHEGEWRAVDAAIDEVEGQIASLQRQADGVGAARTVVAMAPGAMTDERLRGLSDDVADGHSWPVAACRAVLKEIDRLRAIEAIRVADVEAVLQRHAAAVGAVGPMPVEKAADPLVALHAERRDLERAQRSRVLLPAEKDRLGHLLAMIDRLEVEEARQRGEAWTRPEPVKPARPRVGGWVDVGGIPTLFDDRGACVATTWRAGDKGHGWIANRPFDTGARGFEATPEEAKAAAVAVLATWADVEGQPEAVPPLRCDTFKPLAKFGDVFECRRHTWEAFGLPFTVEALIGERATLIRCGSVVEVDERSLWNHAEWLKVEAPPLSLVVAFGSEGAPVILEAAGPWEGIADRPSPPARGLWRWVGKAMREPLDIGGHDFEGAWTLLQVPA